MTAPARRRGPRTAVPTLREERRLLRSGARLVAGVDEVGRGALAGPVTVGVVVVQATTRSAPTGLRDSKLLTPAAREALVPRLRRWATSWAVGHAEPHEIDAHGILSALRLAGNRALARLPEPPDAVLLDGSYDWLTRPALPLSLFGDLEFGDLEFGDLEFGDLEFGDLEPDAAPDVHLAEGCVRTLVKGDLRCAAVAAASVLAKTERDALMRHRAQVYPDYGWAANKGYAAPEHLEALGVLGPCEQHRRSWRLPGAGPAGAVRDDGGRPAAGLAAGPTGTVPLFEDPGDGTMAS